MNLPAIHNNIDFEKSSMSALLLSAHSQINDDNIEDYADQYLALIERSGTIRNKARFIFASILEKIELEQGKQAKLEYLNKTFGEKHSHVYGWVQVYNYLKDKDDEIIDMYIKSEKTGVTIFQYLNTLDKKLSNIDLAGFSNNEIKEIVNTIYDNDLNIENSKNFINNNYLKPKLDNLNESDNDNSNNTKAEAIKNYIIEKADTMYLSIKLDSDSYEMLESILKVSALKNKTDLDMNNPSLLGKVLMYNILENYTLNN